MYLRLLILQISDIVVIFNDFDAIFCLYDGVPFGCFKMNLVKDVADFAFFIG